MKTSAHVDEVTHGRLFEVDLHGKLTRRDFDRVVPETERLIERYGKIRLLVTMHDFEGWDAGGLWEEIKWEAKHFHHMERIAIVGAEHWQKRMAQICNSFTTADVRFFCFDQLDAAYAWVNG
jgi:hypothetical protein